VQGLIDAPRVDQVTIDKGMLARDLGGRATSHLPANTTRLKDRYRQASLRQQVGSRKPDDAGTDDGDVGSARS
jgi:hypothetical protein